MVVEICIFTLPVGEICIFSQPFFQLFFFFDVWVFNFSLSILVQSLTFANIVSLFTPCHDIMWRNYISTSSHSTSHHIKSHTWATSVLHLCVSEKWLTKVQMLHSRSSFELFNVMWCWVMWSAVSSNDSVMELNVTCCHEMSRNGVECDKMSSNVLCHI